MKRESEKKYDKDSFILIIFTCLIITAIGVLCIIWLRGIIANLVLPDTMKKYYMQYEMYENGDIIPNITTNIANNGKLFSFCQSIAAVIVSILFLILGKNFGGKIFERCQESSLKKIIRFFEIVVLLLAIFTFTSKVNPDNNFKKYVINYDSNNYIGEMTTEKSNQENLIGYFRQSDLNNGNSSIGVYKAPVLESRLCKNKIDTITVSLISSIGEIGAYSEMLTVIIGIYLFVLKDYNKNRKNGKE